jgi:uncharacterized protein YacL (UPF0231 family)
MDYDFYSTAGQHRYAECSMGHELFGQWLSDELEHTGAALQPLIAACETLKVQPLAHFAQAGKELTLHLTADQAQLTAHALYHGAEPTEDLSIDDSRLYSACGLEDFHALLCAWRDFITPPFLSIKDTSP